MSGFTDVFSHVAVLSYPMLFQRQGGLQIQIMETISALKQQGIEATLFNPLQDKLADFEVIHVFSAINGNHRIVEAAKDIGKPVVISPLIQPDWTRISGMRERFIDRMVGKFTNCHVKTTYQEIHYCLYASDAVVALGAVEKRSITEAFLIDANKVSVIPNGIPQRFFSATARLFTEKFGIKPGFVLSVAAINPYKNQWALVVAMKDSEAKVVLIGSCPESAKGYLDKILEYPNVVYLGSLSYDDPLLASAYAAAGVFCLPSQSEVMPLSVLEALAAGTPAVMTKNHCMDVGPMRSHVREIEPNDPAAIREAVADLLANPVKPEGCRASVAGFSWDTVAASLAKVYQQVIVKYST